MSRFRPSAAQERWLAVGADAARAGGWRDVSFLARCGLFVLGILTAALVVALVELTGARHARWEFAPLLLVAAESLIVSRRVFGSGFEEALEIGAVIWLVAVINPSETSSSLCWLGAALGISGLRLLNPLFTTLGVLAGIAAINASSGRVSMSAYVCFAIAGVALAASVVTYRRPSYDRMLGWLMVVMPAAATACFFAYATNNLGIIRMEILIPAFVLGCAALIIGITRRMHAPLLTFIVCVLCIANELRKASHLPLESRVIIGGVLALLVAVALDRYLRNGRNGITSRAVGGTHDIGVGLVAALPTQSGTGGAADDKFSGGGGNFSGGGASGTY